MIEQVTRDNIRQAAQVHAAAWRDSHRAICSPEFVSIHTAERQMGYLQSLMEEGAMVYLLSDSGKPVGIVSIRGDVIGDLYVLPSDQRKGFGTVLLRFAMRKCIGTPTLWVLDHNCQAIRLYKRVGFKMTGEKKILSETLSELQMQYMK